MENEKLVVFKKFSDAELAKETAGILSENGIKNLLSDNSPALDITFSGNTLNNQVELKVIQSDFLRARDILAREAEKHLEELDKNHYIFEFSTEELLEILSKPDEWSELDFSMAKKLLKERGQDVSEDLINNLK
ncbi:MAG: hypothetical protein H0X62_10985, partial [Bacteroidetes bacterium]|nr:hypothetical protein [Bacteroidota bacterium]